MVTLPAVFVSHGSPMMGIEDGPAHRFLSNLSKDLPRPRAILAVTPHWETPVPTLSSVAHPSLIYDFYGFPRALYQLTYPAPGAPDVAAEAAALLTKAGIGAELDPERGLDHGTWSPLRLAFPTAEIPIAQLSVQFGRDASYHLAVGRALAPLREQGVLIIGSGGATHNLAHWTPRSDVVPDWAQQFEDWLVDVAERGDQAEAAAWESHAPHGHTAHARDEHFLPFFVAMAAGGGQGRTLHRGFEQGALSMAAFAWG